MNGIAELYEKRKRFDTGVCERIATQKLSVLNAKACREVDVTLNTDISFGEFEMVLISVARLAGDKAWIW